MEEQIKLLTAVLNTLDGVSVAGHENWDRMLGSYNAVKEVKDSLAAMAKPEEETENG